MCACEGFRVQSGAHWLMHVCKQSRLVLLTPADLNSPKEGWEGLLRGPAMGILDWYWLVDTGGDKGGVYTLEH